MRGRAALVRGRRRTGRPAATSALVTWKLPLPTTPNTWPTPCADERAADRLGDTASARSALDQGQHAGRAAGAADDRQRRGDHHRAGRRQRRPGSAAGSGRTCRGRAGTSGTGTAGRTSAPRRRRCRRSPRRRPGSAPPRPATARSRPRCPGCAAARWRNAAWSSARASQPVRYSSQPPSGSGPCSACQASTCSISSRKSGSARGLGGEVEHRRRARSAGPPAPGRRRRRRGR